MTEMKLKEVIKIIKTAKKLGVTKMKLGTLEFELQFEQQNTRASRPALKVSKKTIASLDEINQLQLDLDGAQDDISTMHVEDPEKFEQAIVERELDGRMAGDNGEQVEETHGL